MIDMAAQKTRHVENHGFPTILAAGSNGSFTILVNSIRMDGYLVLEAQSAEDAVHVARVHSREIHVLLADPSVDGPALGETLRPYRPEMQVLLVDGQPQETLAEVRRIFNVNECLQKRFTM